MCTILKRLILKNGGSIFIGLVCVSLLVMFQDQKPLVARAEEVDLAHNMKLKEEAQSIHKVILLSLDIAYLIKFILKLALESD